MKAIWKRKHGLTLMQMKQLEVERACECIAADQERALFAAIESEPRLLAELKREHDEYITRIEQRITNGWRPNAHEWQDIERQLKAFAERRKAIIDPLGLGALKGARC